MRKVLARPWAGVRVCHLLLLLLHKFAWHTDRQLRLIHLLSACRGRTAVRFPATSSRMCCVELVLADRPNKAETAVHDCHCLGDMAVRMRKVLVRPWVGVRVCHLVLLLKIFSTKLE